ncbi:MAG TPA: LPXTG cell wall anchor domain-containing protein [Thermoflexia bacterium]|nr:LPXTG cell wall anchor domain-containing protein [Thermoflexia bacterium]
MVRKSDKVGVDAYVAGEWDTYAQDTFSYLGSHTGPSPTAITLSAFSARGASTPLLLAGAVLALGGVFFWRRKRA